MNNEQYKKYLETLELTTPTLVWKYRHIWGELSRVTWQCGRCKGNGPERNPAGVVKCKRCGQWNHFDDYNYKLENYSIPEAEHPTLW